MNELIVFTHNDLDALGCILSTEFRFPNVPKKYFYTNYSNIDEQVQEIEKFISENSYQVEPRILIADVSFSENKDALRNLNKMGKVTHIDHHLYPQGFWDEFENIKVIHDKTKSASLLCHEYFGNAGKHKTLDKLIRIIDTYDLWLVDKQEFDFSQDLNNYFWENDLEKLAKTIIERDYKLPSDFVDVTTKFNKKSEEAIKSYREQNLIQSSGDITICFVNEYFNQIMIDEMKSGKNVVVGVSSYGIIKVRINQKSSYTEQQLNKIREILTGTQDIGHKYAFTYKYPGERSFDNLMKEVEKMVSTFVNINIL